VRIPFAESLRFPGEGKSAQGKSVPKTRPTGVVDGQQVNIPAPCVKVERIRTLARGGTSPCRWAARKGEGIYDPEASGRTAKKSRYGTTHMTVLKLTQVGEKNILRRSRERW
jgi:hypothetical protein